MKILNIMLGKGRGGLEQVAVDYHHALTMRGHEVHSVFHPKSWAKEKLTLEKINSFDLPNFGEWDPLAVSRIKKLSRVLEPDIAICHGNRAIRLALKALSGKTPVVAVAHNYKNKGYIKCDAVFCITEQLTQRMLDIGFTKKTVFHIPNMVEVPTNITPLQYHNPPTIGSLGRFVEKKGFDVFINSLKLLKKRGISFKAYLAGDGPLINELQTFAQEAELNDWIDWCGWIDDKEDFFKKLDLFVLPSRHEPFGLVLIEALAHGRPSISTMSEGPTEILNNDENGILVPIDDPEAITNALEQLIKNHEKAMLLAKAGMRTVYDTYSISAVSNLMNSAIMELLKNKNMQ